MAIITTVPGLEVTVYIGGATANEYPSSTARNTQTPNSIAKYIECTPGSSFTIRIKQTAEFRPNPTDHISCELAIDGTRTGLIHSPTLASRMRNANGLWEFEWNSLYTQNYLGGIDEGEMTFDTPNVAEIARTRRLLERIPPLQLGGGVWRADLTHEVGTIVVRVWKVAAQERYDRGFLWNPLTPRPTVVFESGYPPIYHTVSANNRIRLDVPPMGKRPIATFEFRYHDIEEIQ
ncbi:hypothetical protein QBC38DRAFT_459335 [Podospora fimiseda]|uniref:DUF7918 domain-containing protein n=1 Tax=Podospora fimiseda TaxID=252190 RepID=A0AAN7GNV7_9PEZI|nr:hypothetical protein QBC38DRAFT_459335 [Podospora fimiseda]